MAAYMIYVSRKLEQILRGESETSWIGELKTAAFWRACLAEFIATTLFVFIGCASIVIGFDVVKVAFTFGLGIMAMVMYTGHISGGHINPAVTIAFAVNLAISPIKAVFYVLAQVVGGIIGAGLLYAVAEGVPRGIIDAKVPQGIIDTKLGCNGLGAGITDAQGFGFELIITYILVSVIMGTTDGKRTSFAGVGLEIGLTVTLCHLAGIAYTGASMNPARSFGPAVVGGISGISGTFDNHWVYWAGPILGGILAGLVYKYILSPYRGVETVDEAMQHIENHKTNVHEMTGS